MATTDITVTLAPPVPVSVVIGPAGTPVQVDVIAVGPTGPPGAAGAPGGSVVLVADGAISGHRVVAEQGDGTAAYADNTNSPDRWSPLGVTTGAAVDGDDVTVVRVGAIDEPSWSWTPLDPVYLGAAGALTQTPPTAPAFLRVVGVATSSTSMWVDVQPPLQLA